MADELGHDTRLQLAECIVVMRTTGGERVPVGIFLEDVQVDKILLLGEVVCRFEVKSKDFFALFHAFRGWGKNHRHDARILANFDVAWIELAHKERAHVRIDVAWLDAKLQCTRDLKAHFAFDFIRRCVLNRVLHRAVDKAFFVVKTRSLLARLQRCPAIVSPLTGQS